MIFTSHQRFVKRRPPSTQTVPFNGEPIYRPLLATPNIIDINNNDALFTEALKQTQPSNKVPRAMVRTYPGEGKRTCCGGAV